MAGLRITNEMQNAFDLIEDGENLFITGSAGSGKTTLLRLLSEKYRNNCIVCAPTGVAAINAGGVTIHKQFSLPIGVINPNEPIERMMSNSSKAVLRKIKILIIDEISMVRCDLMDAINRRMMSVRKNRKPFGGVQIVMFGDMKQLPPVVPKNEESVLLEIYDDTYFFNAKVFKDISFNVIQLTEIFRQNDLTFINCLNSIREANITDDDLQTLNTRVAQKNIDKAINLCAINRVADDINSKMLGYPTHIFNAEIEGDFNERHAICEMSLSLRVGARVMITKNDTQFGLYYNGTLGNVESIGNKLIKVRTDNNDLVLIEPCKWESFKYETEPIIDGNGDVIISIKKIPTGSCTQFPLKLAYAVSIHKSQGLTFDNVILHISDIFESGQLYTALSRCRTLDGITLDTNITRNMLYRNESVENFIKFVELNNHKFGEDKNKKKRNICKQTNELTLF